VHYIGCFGIIPEDSFCIIARVCSKDNENDNGLCTTGIRHVMGWHYANFMIHLNSCARKL